MLNVFEHMLAHLIIMILILFSNEQSTDYLTLIDQDTTCGISKHLGS